ncbi:MAG TPA: glucokinase [Rhizomicrobium sp.]|jgi:glucokinase|nr:glucokinase [Rhizomicrobium sp.]
MPKTTPEHCGLVADIGGTHCRFALAGLDTRAGTIREPQNFAVADYKGVVAAAKAFLKGEGLKTPPEALVFAVAGPVENGRIHFTNSGWSFSESELRRKLGVKRARLVNDFEAQARAVAVLDPAALVHIGGPKAFDAKADGAIALVGPGTGLGVGGLTREGGVSIALVCEGGHASFAPSDKLEIAILELLARRFGHVSNERLLSGPGLANLFGAMAKIEGVRRKTPAPEQITQAALADPKSFEARVFARFCAILGSVAGDVALTMGARAGVLIAGGILPSAVEALRGSEFRARFEAKGRFADYLKAISTRLIVEPHVGLVGAATILRDQAA